MSDATNTTETTPLDRAMAALGIANDSALASRGGPSQKTLSRLRSGRLIRRSDAIARLARALHLSDAEALAIVRETARAARGAR